MIRTKPAAPGKHAIVVPAGDANLEGELSLPQNPEGMVLFAHGSGSSRFSPRNQFVAQALQQGGLATLLFDLLTAREEVEDARTARLRFDMDRLARRLMAAAAYLRERTDTRRLPIGYFGASSGAGAALLAAAQRPDGIGAVVSRGGRPDLAGAALARVLAPTLLIVGSRDEQVLRLNQEALAQINAPKRLAIVPGATHLFEEPGALDEVASLARDWFLQHLAGPSQKA